MASGGGKTRSSSSTVSMVASMGISSGDAPIYSTARRCPAARARFDAPQQGVLAWAIESRREPMSALLHPAPGAEPAASAIASEGGLGDYWPGIQIYYPPVKYAPSLGIYEDLEQAAQRFRKHAWNTTAHTLLFDLEDGCRQKEMSRALLRRELPLLPRRREVQVAVRINPFRTEEYELDMRLVRDLADSFDVVVLAKAGEAYGARKSATSR